MKLVPYDKNKIKKRDYAKSENYLTLTEFADSDLECAKVENFTQANAYICAASLRSSIKRYRFPKMTAIAREGEVYLIKN